VQSAAASERRERLLQRGLVVVRWTGAEILYHPDRVIDRIVRQSRIVSAVYGVSVILLGVPPPGRASARACLRPLGVLGVANRHWHAAHR
jgi:L-fucose isomerase-like protein